MIKVHIVPGWSEGRWHLKKFAANFNDKFMLWPDASSADIIVAHSSGCYSLPKTDNARLVVLIGPPFWPDRPLIVRVGQMVFSDSPKQISRYGPRFWLNLRAHNLLYAIVQPWVHAKAWRQLRVSFEKSLKAHQAILIRNTGDAYCGPSIKSHVKKFKKIDYYELPGLHEDCWYDSKPFIEIFNSYL